MNPNAPTASSNARQIGLLGSLLKIIITAAVSCALTCIVAIPSTIYFAGQTKQAERDAAKRIADQVIIDHDGQIKLAAAVQNLSESVISLAARVSQMDAVHASQMINIDNQLKAIDSKVDNAGAAVRDVNQAIIHLSEKIK